MGLRPTWPPEALDSYPRDEAPEWVAKTAVARRCAQETRQFMPHQAVGELIGRVLARLCQCSGMSLEFGYSESRLRASIGPVRY